MNALALDRPALVLAPHLEVPARQGDNILVERSARAFSTHLPAVDVVAKDQVMRYAAGRVVRQVSFANDFRPPKEAGMLTLIRGSAYLVERFLTPAFHEVACERLRRPEYGSVWYSYIETSSVREGVSTHPNRFEAIWTHNDPFKWFRTLQEATRNPLKKAVAWQSRRWHRWHGAQTRDLLHLHVTEADRVGYEQEVGARPGLVVPVGTDLPTLADVPPRLAGAPPILLFVGTLSVQTNADALAHLAARFAPALQAKLGDALKVRVIGSRPTPAVRALCEREGWSLHADVSDDELARHYAKATCAVLPFAYATGAKLKLLGALAHGVPVAATSAVGAQIPQGARDLCLASDDPDAWGDHVHRLAERGLDMKDRARLQGTAELYSWDSIVERLVASLGG